MSYQQKAIIGSTPFPDKPLFLAKLDAVQNNVTGDATTYDVPFNEAIVDRTGDFNTGTGVYTFPVTGAYQINYNVDIRGLAAGNTVGQLSLLTTTNSYLIHRGNYGVMRDGVNSIVELSTSSIVNVTAGDTLICRVQVSGGTQIVDIFGQVGTFLHTWVSGVFLG